MTVSQPKGNLLRAATVPLSSLVPVLPCRSKTPRATATMHRRPTHFIQPRAVMARGACHSAAITSARLPVSNTLGMGPVCQRIQATMRPGRSPSCARRRAAPATTPTSHAAPRRPRPFRRRTLPLGAVAGPTAWAGAAISRRASWWYGVACNARGFAAALRVCMRLKFSLWVNYGSLDRLWGGHWWGHIRIYISYRYTHIDASGNGATSSHTVHPCPAAHTHTYACIHTYVYTAQYMT